MFTSLIRAIERKIRNRERRKLYLKLIAISKERAAHPERHAQYSATVRSHMERLHVLHVADIEARQKPAPLWPGLPTERPKRPIIEIIEDDATPAHHWHGYGFKRAAFDDDLESIVGEWRAPV
jgi:hypothetical protein